MNLISKVAGLDPLELLQHHLGISICMLVFGKAFSKDDKTWRWLLELQEEGTRLIGISAAFNFFPFLRYYLLTASIRLRFFTWVLDCRFLPKFKKTMDFLINGIKVTHEEYQKWIDRERKLLEGDAENVIQAFLVAKEVSSGKPSEKFYSNSQFHYLLADLFGAGLDTTLCTLRSAKYAFLPC